MTSLIRHLSMEGRKIETVLHIGVGTGGSRGGGGGGGGGRPPNNLRGGPIYPLAPPINHPPVPAQLFLSFLSLNFL